MLAAQHLYVHVPFCSRRCVYCDFSIAVRRTVPSAAYTTAVGRELEIRHAGASLSLDTLYLGGGTPSKLGAGGVTRLMDVLSQHVTIRPDAEITIEANPEDVSPQSVSAWVASGINRVSLGVQSFDDRTLQWMRRTHDASESRMAIEVLQEAGVANVSLDLIFAVPARANGSWDRDLETALGLGLSHVSVYGLTVEPHAPLGKLIERGQAAESPEESFGHEFLRAHELLTAAGYEHYEVSNYCKPGRASRHNWAYWDRRDYVGIGPSAHEFLGRTRRWNVSPYSEWIESVTAGRDPLGGYETLDHHQEEAERRYLGLRTQAGVTVSEAEVGRVQTWVDAGWAVLGRERRLRLSPQGWLRLDAIAADLTAIRNR